MSAPRIEVWALPRGGWNVAVLIGDRTIAAVSGPEKTPRNVRRALKWAAQLRRTLDVQRRQHA